MAIMDQILEVLAVSVKEGLKLETGMNTQIGAILLCEDLARTLRGLRFVTIFESLVQSMHSLVETRIDTFKSTV